MSDFDLSTIGQLDRPLGQQHISSSSRRLGAAIVLRLNQRQWIAYPRTPLNLGIPIDDYLSEVAQQLGRSILPGLELEEARGNVDHSGGRLAIDKILVIDDIFQKEYWSSPLILISRKARCMRSNAWGKFGPEAVIFTRRES